MYVYSMLLCRFSRLLEVLGRNERKACWSVLLLWGCRTARGVRQLDGWTFAYPFLSGVDFLGGGSCYELQQYFIAPRAGLSRCTRFSLELFSLHQVVPFIDVFKNAYGLVSLILCETGDLPVV